MDSCLKCFLKESGRHHCNSEIHIFWKCLEGEHEILPTEEAMTVFNSARYYNHSKIWPRSAWVADEFLYLFVFVLMGWSLLSNALRPFKICCAPSILGITRTSICRLNFAQRPIFSGLRFFNEPEISYLEPPV